jgi:hypothetical protein
LWNVPHFTNRSHNFHILQIDSTISTFYKSIPHFTQTFCNMIHFIEKNTKLHKFYINCCFVKATTLSPVSVLCHVREQEFRQSRELEKTAYVEISKKQWVFQVSPAKKWMALPRMTTIGYCIRSQALVASRSSYQIGPPLFLTSHTCTVRYCRGQSSAC